MIASIIHGPNQHSPRVASGDRGSSEANFVYAINDPTILIHPRSIHGGCNARRRGALSATMHSGYRAATVERANRTYLLLHRIAIAESHVHARDTRVFPLRVDGTTESLQTAIEQVEAVHSTR